MNFYVGNIVFKSAAGAETRIPGPQQSTSGCGLEAEVIGQCLEPLV